MLPVSQAVPALALAAALCVPLAACQAPAGDEHADETPETSTAYQQRVAEEHRGDRPVPGFAREEDAPRVEVTAERVQYATVGGRPVTGYLAVPAGAEKRPDEHLPGLIVIHEWWGLNENIETMARMFARQGYEALAVDLYGGQVADRPERARELVGSVDEAAARDNLEQAEAYLREKLGAPKVGVIGWCFGGGWSLETALALPDRIDAAVVYYGRLTTDRDRLAKLDMPILAFFGAEDSSIPQQQIQAFERTLRDLGKDVQVKVYENAGHAFANPSGERYRPEAAKDAWEKTLAFLSDHLQS